MTWTVDQIGEALRNYQGGNLQNPGGGSTDWNGPPAWMLAGLKSGDASVNPQLQLQLLKQYDPNASLTDIGTTGALDENGMPTGGRLNFDQSKLPQQQQPGLVQFQAGARDLKLQNPNLIYNDPNYGPMTAPNNATYTSDRPDWMSIVGPLLVGGFAGLAAGGLGLAGAAVTKLPNVASMVAGMGQGQSQLFNNPTGPQSSYDPQQAALLRAMQTGQ